MTPPPAALNETNGYHAHTNGHAAPSKTNDVQAHADKLMNAVPVASGGTGERKKRFDPKTYAPDARFSTPVVKERLAQSILHEFSPEEAGARIELAACYRLFGKWGWNEAIYNHLTAQIIDEATGKHCFLINPMGLLYEEVTASSLLKIDLEGNILHHGVIGDIFGVNKAGFVIHGAIHAARHDLKAVMHCHYAPSAGISATKQGFQELAQTSHICGPITYHDYEGLVVDLDEQKRLVADLGENKVMFLKNHGIITCGSSIAEAWYLHYVLLKACEIQVAAGAAACDRESLLLPPEETIQKTMAVAKHFSGSGMGIKELSAYMRLIDREDDSYRN